MLLELLDPCTWGRYVVPKRRQLSTNQRCLTSQNSDDPIYATAEA
jgi:hypothetical protein